MPARLTRIPISSQWRIPPVTSKKPYRHLRGGFSIRRGTLRRGYPGKKDGKWYAYEVKSTTGVKDPHKMDAALQYYVITRSGLALADISILHLNNQYIRNGELDLNQLFTIIRVRGSFGIPGICRKEDKGAKSGDR